MHRHVFPCVVRIVVPALFLARLSELLKNALPAQTNFNNCDSDNGRSIRCTAIHLSREWSEILEAIAKLWMFRFNFQLNFLNMKNDSQTCTKLKSYMEYGPNWIFDTLLFVHPGLQNHKQSKQANKQYRNAVNEFTLTFSLRSRARMRFYTHTYNKKWTRIKTVHNNMFVSNILFNEQLHWWSISVWNWMHFLWLYCPIWLGTSPNLLIWMSWILEWNWMCFATWNPPIRTIESEMKITITTTTATTKRWRNRAKDV